MAHDDVDEILHGFYEESKEHLDGIENDFLAIEKAGVEADPELVNRVFRAIHTIKGGCGFFGLAKLGELTHAMESLLDKVRKRTLAPTSAMVNTLLAGVDAIKTMIDDPSRTEGLDTSPLLAQLAAIMNGTLTTSEKVRAAETVDVRLPDGRIIFTLGRDDVDRARNDERGGVNIYLLEYDLIKDIERKGKTPWDVIAELLQLVSFIDSKVDIEGMGELSMEREVAAIPFYALVSTVIDPELLKEFLGLDESKLHLISTTGDFMDLGKTVGGASAVPAVSVPQSVPSAPSAGSIPVQTAVAPAKSPECAAESKGAAMPPPLPKAPADASSIRVSVALLDKLMNLAGELVLARNQLVLSSGRRDADTVAQTTQRIDGVTGELQEAIMATRMQAVGTVFGKFQRVVRDLSRDLGKQVELQLDGEDVELDRSIIEAIGDPLVHLVRNSLDHGIERPDTRAAAGKPPAGTLRISAFQEGGHVIIQVVDDGAGINPERIRAKALSQGLYTKEQLATISDKEVLKMIFLPGFSTAEKVTDISGRGVGMDVVHTNLAKVGGTVEIESEVGKGTTIKVKLPLTLAIIASLLVSVEGQRYAIPQVNIAELMRIPAKERAKRIETIGGSEVTRLRGRLLPLVRLRATLGIAGAEADMESAPVNVAVVQAGDLQYGLVVDAFLDSYEVVVKPLGRHLKPCGVYSGATILGDGAVALILDVAGIAKTSRLSEFTVADDGHGSSEGKTRPGVDRQVLVVVRNGGGELFAATLGLVLRIEKIKRSCIELVAGRKTIQYRGGVLPLFAIEEVAHVAPRDDTETILILVYKAGGREVGLMFSEVIDVFDTDAEVDAAAYAQPGIYGAAVINEHVTLLLDLHGIVHTAMPHWRREPSVAVDAPEGHPRRTPSIFVAEDSPFFMSQFKTTLVEAGYKVTTATDGAAALERLRENPDAVDLLVTDIEMPKLDGVELTRRLRGDPRFDKLPIVAVTSLAGEAAERQGLEAGLDEYLLKFDKEQLLDTCARYLSLGRDGGHRREEAARL